MIDVSGHLFPEYNDSGFEDSKKTLVINCCGYQFFNLKDFEKYRPSGRKDYQIMYISKGFAHYNEGGTWKCCGEGHIIFYKPHEIQHYRYYCSDKTEIFWIHFTGYLAEDLMTHSNLSCEYIGTNPEIQSLFKIITSELQLKKTGFHETTVGLFYQLLGLLLRTKSSQTTEPNSKLLIEQLIIHLNKYYMEPWTIESMAYFCNLSDYYFSHYFKTVTGISPIQYLTQLRLSKGKRLLLGTTLPISHIAFLVGYKDSLYFSRLFRKHFGMSPRAYKSQNEPPLID